MTTQRDPDKVVREIKRRTRRKFNSEEKISIVLEGLRGEQTIAELCRREGISPNLYELLQATQASSTAGLREVPLFHKIWGRITNWNASTRDTRSLGLQIPSGISIQENLVLWDDPQLAQV